MSFYTDKAKGVLTEQRFMKLTTALEQEQEANQKCLQDLTLMMRRSNEQEGDRLISRILVSEVKKIDGHKVQEVKIVYNFVGEILATTE